MDFPIKKELFIKLTKHLDVLNGIETLGLKTKLVEGFDQNNNFTRCADKISSLMETFNTVNISYPLEYYSDILQMHQFLNMYLDFLGLRDTFPNGVSMEYLEGAIINRHSAALYQLMFIFLSIIFKFQSIEYDPQLKHSKCVYDKHIEDYYGCRVHELPCDEITISEVLRLHIVTSHVSSVDNSGGAMTDETHDGYCTKQRLAEEFIQNHSIILQSLHHATIYGLSSGDLLIIFMFLLNQILTFNAIRSKIESYQLPNYLGCDQSNRKYWRFELLPGIYIECADCWKYIDTTDMIDLLIETIPETMLKQNLIEYQDIIKKAILQSRHSSTRPMDNKYEFKNFKSIDNWHLLWEQKLSNFQDLIQENDLFHQPEYDFDYFQKNFYKWTIPRNQANSIEQSTRLNEKRNINIEMILCKLHDIQSIQFPEDALNTIKTLASILAYTYYTLDKVSTVIEIRRWRFQSFLRIESVAELFLNFYRLYDDLLVCRDKCSICHTGRDMRSIECNRCRRSFHVRCLVMVPILMKLNTRICVKCQFRDK